MSKNFEKLESHVFVTKLAGFEHTEYIQHNQTHVKENIDDIPLVQGKNIRNGFFVKNHDWFIKKEISDKLIRSKLNKECILVPYVGSNLGEVGIFYNDYECHMASNIAKIELVDDYFDIEFLKYYLQSSTGQKYLFQAKQGSSQPNITMEAIRNTLVFDIDKKKQNRIAKALKIIDDKILHNNKINSELEKLAKTLYDYWFIQFDFPDENNRPYKSSGGAMIYNDVLKREIPQGWNVEQLKNVLSLLKDGTHNPPQRVQKGIPLLTGTMFGNNFLNYEDVTYITEQDYINIHKSYKPNIKDILLTKIGTVGKVNILEKEDIPITIHCNSAILRVNERFLQIMLFFLMKSDEFQGHLKRSMSKTIQEFINLDKLGDIFILNIPLNTQKRYEKFVMPLYEKLHIIRKENQKLIMLRDFLLPMLMNGQVTIQQ